MNKNPLRFLFTALAALLLACTGVVVANMVSAVTASANAPARNIVSLSGQLTQTKVTPANGNKVGLALTLSCDDIKDIHATQHGVDLVVVLDRSGSMAGSKIRDARNAVAELISALGPGDRFGLVSYANDVTVHGQLVPVTAANRPSLLAGTRAIEAGGGTNLGGGLAAGLEMLSHPLRTAGPQDGMSGNLAKVILISDGHANQGIVDPVALGHMAARAYRTDASVTAVGVGVDYNEQLMGTIADHGGGNYYFLEDPARFASLFLEELSLTRAVAARNLEVHIPLPQGVTVADAAGYPLEMQEQVAVLRPGSLRSGQTRTIFLTLQLSGGSGSSYVLDHMNVDYQHADQTLTAAMAAPLAVDVVADQDEAYASIDPALWTRQTVQEDYNRLREEVARDVAGGDKEAAMARIDAYEAGKRASNEKVGSTAVAQNLDRDLPRLKQVVEESLAPSAPMATRKQASKAMQAESYDTRRAKTKN